MSNCGAYELLFCEAATGEHFQRPSKLADVSWASMTCVLSRGTLGIWQKGMDGTDINAVDRSPSGSLIATADDFGTVRVFAYPCTEEFSPSVAYKGHSSHVTCCRWYSCDGKNDSYLLTTGGEDKCVFQWRNATTEPHVKNGFKQRWAGNIATTSATADEDEEEEKDYGILAPPSGGDEFMAIKPWVGAIKVRYYSVA